MCAGSDCFLVKCCYASCRICYICSSFLLFYSHDNELCGIVVILFVCISGFFLLESIRFLLYLFLHGFLDLSQCFFLVRLLYNCVPCLECCDLFCLLVIILNFE